MHITPLASLGLLAVGALALPTPETAPKKRSTRLQARHLRPEKRTIVARDGTVSASNDGGGWLVSAVVGPSTLTLNVDTGSSDLWVASTLLPSDEQAYVSTGHALYDPSQSSSAAPLDGESFNIGYGDGSGSSGPEYTETVALGDIALAGMPIGVANSLHLGTNAPAGSTRNSDGPVGLGFQSINSVSPDKQPTFAEALQSAGALTHNVFTTHLTTDDSGEILFGNYDSSLYTGTLTQVPVDNSQGFWIIDSVSFSLNGQSISSSAINMIGDTGGPGLDIPADALAAYFAAVDGSGQDSNGNYFYPCGADLPDLELSFPTVLNGGPGTATVSGDKIKDGDGDAGSNCYTYFGVANGQGSLGIPFFTSQYIEWDMGVPSMAFASQA